MTLRAPARPITAPLPLRTTPRWRMRPIDFCKPTDSSEHLRIVRFLYSRRGRHGWRRVSRFGIRDRAGAISPSFTAMSPALSSRTGIGSVAVPEAAAARSRDLNRYLPMRFIGGWPSAKPDLRGRGFWPPYRDRWRCLWHHCRARIVVSDSLAPRAPLSRRFVKSVGLVSPWCLRSGECASMSWPLYATMNRCARHADDVGFRPPPRAWGDVRASMSSFSRSFFRPRAAVITRCKLLRSANITAGPLAELPAIELSIREHDRVRSRPVRSRDRPAFSGAGLRASRSGAGRLSLPGGGRHLHRSRGADDNPLLPRPDITQTPLVASWWRNPAQGPGSHPPISVSLARIV